ncbi:MAG: ABC transporter permease [Dehalococcoidia bacterium]|nr:ABC transporter permease [Dehalococcoidia bacterium]
MLQYIIRRILLMIPTLIGVSLLVTALLRLLPSDAVDILVAGGEVQGGQAAFKELVDARLASDGKDPATASITDRARAENALISAQLQKDGIDFEKATDPQKNAAKSTLSLEQYKDNIRKNLGLDKNYFEQWFSWATDAVRGDLGHSILGSRPVSDELKRRIPVSVELGLLGMLVSVVIALPLGVASAVKQDGFIDYGLRSFAIAMLAVPSFFIATIVIALSARWWSYSFPVRYEEFWENPKANLELVLVPALILGIGLSGTLLRLTRAQMLEVLRQDYIRTARSKGLGARSVIIRHALRNAMVPVVTVIGLQVPVLVGGSLVLEQIFGIPGIANYLFVSIANRDFPAIIGVNMVVAVTIVMVNLLVDVMYAVLDPRVRLA